MPPPKKVPYALALEEDRDLSPPRKTRKGRQPSTASVAAKPAGEKKRKGTKGKERKARKPNMRGARQIEDLSDDSSDPSEAELNLEDLEPNAAKFVRNARSSNEGSGKAAVTEESSESSEGKMNLNAHSAKAAKGSSNEGSASLLLTPSNAVAVNRPASAATGATRTPYRNVTAGSEVQAEERPLSYLEANIGMSNITKGVYKSP
jgi:hypothetical protein